MLIFAQI